MGGVCCSCDDGCHGCEKKSGDAFKSVRVLTRDVRGASGMDAEHVATRILTSAPHHEGGGPGA